MYAVELKGLVKEFGKKEKFLAVNDVSIQIEEGEKVAIIGPNGAGKTTTLMMMLGLITPTSGSAKIFNVPSVYRNSKALKSVGFCAGYANFKSELKVFHILKSYAMGAGIINPNDDVEEIVEKLGIKHLLNRSCKSLSSGQGTLVSVAKALVHKPKIAVMDEPTAFTDPEISKRIQNILDLYNKEYNMTVIITSHDMVEVERICDRVIFISQGKIILDSSLDKIFEKTGFKSLEEAWLSFAKEYEDLLNQETEI